MKRLYPDRSRLKSGLQSDRAKGFTLIESALVVLVIGMIAVVAVPRIISTDKNIVHATVRQMTADMRYARNLAITNMENHIIQFSPAGGPYTKYEVFRASDMVNSIKSKDIPTEVTCTAAGGFVVPDELTFTPLGSVNGAGQIILVSEPAGSLKYISAISATGRVYLSE